MKIYANLSWGVATLENRVQERNRWFRRDRYRAHAKKKRSGKQPSGNYSDDESSFNRSTDVILISSDASDAWRLDGAAEAIRSGQVGIVPTDTFPALVCDLESKDAVRTLYELKKANPSTKSMSILVRNFTDISTYTTGFPVSRAPGQEDFFKIAKRILPGPYTLILPSSKNMPKQFVDFEAGKSKKRTAVGVRLVDNAICSALMERLDRPLLSSSAILPDMRDHEGKASAVPDIGSLMDFYGPALGFVVGIHEDDVLWGEAGSVEGSTVLDLTGTEIEVVRYGAGDVSWL